MFDYSRAAQKAALFALKQWERPISASDFLSDSIFAKIFVKK